MSPIIPVAELHAAEAPLPMPLSDECRRDMARIEFCLSHVGLAEVSQLARRIKARAHAYPSLAALGARISQAAQRDDVTGVLGAVEQLRNHLDSSVPPAALEVSPSSTPDAE